MYYVRKKFFCKLPKNYICQSASPEEILSNKTRVSSIDLFEKYIEIYEFSPRHDFNGSFGDYRAESRFLVFSSFLGEFLTANRKFFKIF